MDRRPVGVALLVVALAAVMVVPALSGLRSIGTAVPIDLPDPPTVGDCVARLSRPVADDGQIPPRLPVSAVLFGSCRGAIAGEVVAFWSTGAGLAVAPRSRRAGPCYLPMAQYLGLSPAGSAPSPAGAAGGEATEPLAWRPVLSYRAYLLTPSDLERRAGREWSACVIGPEDDATYRGRLAGAYQDGSLPTAFGSCWTPDDSGLFVGPGECTREHGAQLVATGRSGDRGFPPAAEVDESCARVAGRLMDTGDPTRGGQLTIRADRMDRLTRSWSGNPSSFGCFVATTGGRTMTGLIVGLGDRPVPFGS